MTARLPWLASLIGAAALLASCATPERPVLRPLSALGLASGAATPRVNGIVGSPEAPLSPQISYGRGTAVTLPPLQAGERGTISLDFADTDIREVAAQILGNILKLNYTIDPAVKGTATLRTTTPVSTAQLLPVLQALLAQNGATLLLDNGIYRVVPAAAGSGPGLAASAAVGGGVVVQLRYASADQLAKILQPFAGTNAKVTADSAHNVLLISGDPAARAALLNLVQAFDVNVLAGQSYALFPVTSGNAKDFATALQTAFRSQTSLSGVLQVVPMERMNSVLVISPQSRYIDDARRVYALVERARRETARSWHLYYLQNSDANNVAYLLQEAFTPGNVTAQPSASGQTAPGQTAQHSSSSGFGGITAASASGGGTLGQSSTASGPQSAGLGGNLTGGATVSSGTAAGQSGTAGAGSQTASANPLLGGLDASASSGDANSMRIIPNPQNNAIMIYATADEEDTIDAMLRKIDIMPLQVRIDATIAEVTLDDQLQYGTQFFFKGGGINGILNNTAGALGATPATTVLGAAFPGFVLSGNGAGGAPAAISALQAVTTVKVLSSPELMVLDNSPARLQVGNLVPYLTTSSQSALTTNAPVINSIAYQPTGVILEVTPRVNSGGLVTMDISQEVSSIDTTTTASSTINSPTFLERKITSRVVVQDGQTIGLAGLISDNSTRGNQGIPWLKDIPLLGALVGTQNNTRTRTELLVLITPHVIHDQHDARALAEDLRDQLINAAAVPDALNGLRPSGSDDPNQRLRQQLQLR